MLPREVLDPLEVAEALCEVPLPRLGALWAAALELVQDPAQLEPRLDVIQKVVLLEGLRPAPPFLAVDGLQEGPVAPCALPAGPEDLSIRPAAPGLDVHDLSVDVCQLQQGGLVDRREVLGVQVLRDQLDPLGSLAVHDADPVGVPLKDGEGLVKSADLHGNLKVLRDPPVELVVIQGLVEPPHRLVEALPRGLEVKEEGAPPQVGALPQRQGLEPELRLDLLLHLLVISPLLLPASAQLPLLGGNQDPEPELRPPEAHVGGNVPLGPARGCGVLLVPRPPPEDLPRCLKEVVRSREPGLVQVKAGELHRILSPVVRGVGPGPKLGVEGESTVLRAELRLAQVGIGLRQVEQGEAKVVWAGILRAPLVHVLRQLEVLERPRGQVPLEANDPESVPGLLELVHEVVLPLPHGVKATQQDLLALAPLLDGDLGQADPVIKGRPCLDLRLALVPFQRLPRIAQQLQRLVPGLVRFLFWVPALQEFFHLGPGLAQRGGVSRRHRRRARPKIHALGSAYRFSGPTGQAHSLCCPLCLNNSRYSRRILFKFQGRGKDAMTWQLRGLTWRCCVETCYHARSVAVMLLS